MNRMDPFKSVGTAKMGRDMFDLSYSKLFTCDMGQLIPVLADEVYPGDIWKIGFEMVVRMMPLVAPILTSVYARIHCFFVPNRLLWDSWEDFITGGEDGEDASVLPRWTPTDYAVGSLWDFFGFPTGFVPTGALPLDFAKRAYNLIWNEYYRDQNVMEEVDIETSEEVLKASWIKDYFASALPWQQRGTAPSMPLLGTVPVEGIDSNIEVSNAAEGIARVLTTIASDDSLTAPGTSTGGATRWVNPSLQVDLSDATATFDTDMMRTMFQTQRWLERNARSGSRYIEQLKAHFNESNGDARLKRPEYVGGVKWPLIVSEVLQTSESNTTPQGNLAGHGITAGRDFAGEYHATEHGWMVAIMSIMPMPEYTQGIDRQFLRRDKLDYYFPEFANLSEQGIERAEIYASAVEAENRTIFGYAERFAELRSKRNITCSLMRTDFDYWNLARQFSAAPELNEAFLLMDSTTDGAANPYKRIFAVPSEPGFVVSVGNNLPTVRMLPAHADPGLIDHV